MITIPRGGRLLEVRRSDDLATVRFRGRPADDAPGRVVGALPEGLQLRSLPDRDADMDSLRARPDVLFCHHAYVAADGGEPVFLTDRIRLHLEDGPDPARVRALAAEHQLEVGASERRGTVLIVTAGSGGNALKVAARLAAEPDVRAAEPELVFGVRPCAPAAAGGDDAWHLAALGLPEAWEVTRGDRSVVVAVLDDGFDLDHPSLAAAGKVTAPYDFYAFDPVPEPMSQRESHGTATAALAVGDDPAEGFSGAAPGCSLMPLRVAGALSDRMVGAALAHAFDRGAGVILCPFTPGPADFPLSRDLDDTLTWAAEHAVVVFPAGNHGGPVSGDHAGVAWHNGFAAHQAVLTVGALTSEGERAPLSGFGPEVDAWAPSGGGGGRSLRTADLRAPAGSNPFGDYDRFGGTSAASALAAGVAALVRAAGPGLTAAQARGILADQADGETALDAAAAVADARDRGAREDAGTAGEGRDRDRAVGRPVIKLPPALKGPARIRLLVGGGLPTVWELYSYTPQGDAGWERALVGRGDDDAWVELPTPPERMGGQVYLWTVAAVNLGRQTTTVDVTAQLRGADGVVAQAGGAWEITPGSPTAWLTFEVRQA